MRQNEFHHRRDENGLFESVCQLCFRMVGRGKTEADLMPVELEHRCDPEHLVPARFRIRPEPK